MNPALNGWIGPKDNLLHYLAVVHCDRDEQGNFCVDGDITAGLGGEEIVVGASAVYYCNRVPKALAGGLRDTSYGVGVTVL